MNASNGRVFYYHADANAVGGVIQRPYQQVISSAASTSLSAAGGHSAGNTVSYRLDHILSCDAAYTNCSGSVDEDTAPGTNDGPWTSLVTSVVEGVNILHVVTADKVVSQLSVKHPRKGYVPTVSLVGSQFVNLRVNGEPLEVKMNLQVLGSKQKKGTPSVSFHRNPDVLRTAAEHGKKLTGSAGSPQWVKDRYGWLTTDKGPQERDYVLCSIVQDVRCVAPIQSVGHIVHIPDFGNLILGELMVTSGAFHLTMLRAEMGCAAQGTVTVSTARSNGSPIP